MVKAHFIINPASRDFRCGKAWPGIKKRLTEKGFDVIEHMTERIGHGAELTHQIRTEIESNGDESPLVVAVAINATNATKNDEINLSDAIHSEGTLSLIHI